MLLAISGLALFHPKLFFLTGLFGGGQNTRAIHPWIGVVLFFSFLGLFIRFWRANLWRPEDGTWMRRLYDVLTDHEEHLPEVGKYNAGQKIVFWTMSILIIMLISQRPGDLGHVFRATTRRSSRSAIAVLVHSIAAIVIICVWIVHVYAAIWVRGTIRGDDQGPVTGGWAWRHHRKWLRELVTGKRGDQSTGSTPAE